ncbi:MAG: LacI family DNA-binding transcriptional regulator [Lachnospiraceae bacterium]|nr:LacI family DNA-binding transcriptional regulator [Lachnospiraceae bacterium]
MVTIKDVAAEAGVAISTVSKVLNGYEGVSPLTKEKVNSAVTRLGFTPNSVAAALSSKRSKRIALLVKLVVNNASMDEINMRYLFGAISSAMDNRLDAVTVFYETVQDMDEEALTAYLKSQSIEGIIVFGLNREDEVLLRLIDSETFKIVVVGSVITNRSTSSVAIDYAAAQYDVIMRTFENIEGNRILYIAGKDSSYSTALKLEGLRRIEDEMKTKAKVVYGDFSELTARELTFKYAEKSDVIACGSDLMAIGAMRALMELDIFKPVCGFGGIKLMAYAGKQMNTVRQDFEALSREAVKRVRELLGGAEGASYTMEYDLVRVKYRDALI